MKLGEKNPIAKTAEELGYDYNPTLYGTGQDLASNLFNELQNNGYALTIEDVQNATLQAMRTLASFAILEVQRNSTEPLMLSLDTPLEAGESEIIRPYLRAYCDVEQARLMDATKSMGTDGYTIDQANANTNLATELDNLKRNAYFEPPFMFSSN